MIWLVVWNINFMTFHILGIVTPTDFHIFQRGRAQPPTSKWIESKDWKSTRFGVGDRLRQTQVDWEIQLDGYLTSTSIFCKKWIHDWPPIPWWISPSSIHNHNPDIMIDNWILLWMRHYIPYASGLWSGYILLLLTKNHWKLYLVISGYHWNADVSMGMSTTI